MIIYNVTIKVDENISKDWLQWLLAEHIPDMLDTKCFHDYKVIRLLDIDDREGPTYAVQYYALSKAQYDTYMEKFALEMRNRSVDKWGARFTAFRSLMEVVQ